MKDNNIYHGSEEGYIEVIEGISRKTLVFGDKALLAEFKLQKGKNLPAHKHPEEQVGYLVAGHIILQINGEGYEMNSGDSWAIPGDVEHSAEIIADSIAIEVFAPVRKDYIPGS